MLTAAALLILAVATGLVLRAIIRGRRDLQALREQEQAERLNLVAYHARRAHEIRAAITTMGDDAQHLFPPAHNGGS